MRAPVSPIPLRVAIIGGGISGTLVAVNLLRLARGPLEITLIERDPPVGRGVAYRTWDGEHLLNVTAAGLGAFPDAPGDFLEWAKAHAGRFGFPDEVGGEDFLPRHVYGHYVYHKLVEARERARRDVVFRVVAGEVIDIGEGGGQARLQLRDGMLIAADQVVLALGNLPGEYPIRRSLPFYKSARYVHVPWRDDALDRIPADSGVLLVGSGLTAVDMINSLVARGHRGPIHALSRRGLSPQVHRVPLPKRPLWFSPEEPPKGLRALVRSTRAEVARAAAEGEDWRAVVDALRPVTSRLWQGLDLDDRRRFLAHVRPFWEIHRHRLAPAVHARIEALRTSGRLTFHSGRLVEFDELDGTVEATWRCRRDGSLKKARVSKVINCTGPRSDYSKFQHPLFINLLARGLIDHDPLALGLHAEPDGRVRRYRWEPSGWLHSLGAPIKGVLWECTAIPEIRAQAFALASRLLDGV